MDKIIINYLLGEISLEEQHKLSKWLDDDEANPVILEQMKKYWQQGELSFPDKKLKVLNRIKPELESQLEKTYTQPVIRFKSVLKYAAVVILVSIISIYSYTSLDSEQIQQISSIRYVEKVSQPGQKITTILPDGTKVKLNAGSKIIVPEKFESDKREVKLEGEAFFEVVPDPQKPFYVHFHDNQVKVLGTSFNIQAYSKDKNNVVAVKTGKVLVSQGDDEISLTPNELTVLDGSKLEIAEFENRELLFGWIDNKLTFNKATLVEVMETVSNWYGISYQLNQQIDKTKLYTASHSNPTLKEVMEILAYTYNLKYEIFENTIIIK